MVESSFENKLVLENGASAKEGEADCSLVATYCSSVAVDFVQKPRTLYSSNALRRVANVKDLTKKKESLTMQNIKFKGGTSGLQTSKSRLFQSMDNVEESGQVRSFRSCSYIANQVSFRSPRGADFTKEVHRSIHDSLGANDVGVIEEIEEKNREEEDSTESEDDTSSDGGSDSSIDAALDGEENEEAMYKKV